MPWFKIDDGFWSHPKTLLLSDGAVALWLRAGSWSMHHLTDGFIPDHALRILGAKPKNVTELQEVSLWIRVENGNQFHDWGKYQPTREQVEADRRDAAERKRKSREKSQRDGRVTDAGVTGSVTPTPTRPDPTRPFKQLPEVSQGVLTGVEPPLFCPNHPRGGPSCGPCADARRLHAVWERSQKSKPTPLPPRREEGMCVAHKDYPLPCLRCADEVAS